MTALDNFFREVATYTVIGAIFALPLSLSEFPWIYLSMLIPAGLSYFHVTRLKSIHNSFSLVWLNAIGPFIGVAGMFHLVHGEWDYQGVIMGLIGWIVLVPLFIMVARNTIDGDTAQQGGSSEPQTRPAGL